MKMVHIGLEVLKTTDDYYRTEARKLRESGRPTSKSALMRDVLVSHAEKAQENGSCAEPTQSAKAR